MLTCARKGHVTYAPDEPRLRDRLGWPTAAGQSWRCLRCGAFVLGEPQLTGPASDVPHVRRDRELRGVFILRIFAVERILRAAIVAVAAYAVWRFQYSRVSVEQAFDRELPRLRPFFNQIGYDLDHSKVVDMIKHAFTLKPSTLRWLAILLAIYAVVEIVEAIGLWLAKRWGEYFAMVATSAGLPLEIYELAHKITFLRAGAFLINVALVVYLVIAKRLFGIRGGGKAYEARLRSESILDTELKALAAHEAAQHGAGGAGRIDSAHGTGRAGDASGVAAHGAGKAGDAHGASKMGDTHDTAGNDRADRGG